jgi:hypothetical protein
MFICLKLWFDVDKECLPHYRAVAFYVRVHSAEDIIEVNSAVHTILVMNGWWVFLFTI